MVSAPAITGDSTMGEVLEACPSAQRALFHRYHIGGGNSCGYQPGDTLEEVARGHNILDVDEVVAFVEHAEQIDGRLGVSPGGGGRCPRERRRAPPDRRPQPGGVGVGSDRGRDAHDGGALAGADPPAQAHAHRLLLPPRAAQPRRRVSSYFAGHGFTNVQSMTGGLDAWSLEVDPSVARYEVARDPFGGGASLRPLRSAVSEAEGHQSTEGGR